MPTGYTSKLYEGEPQTVANFILDCSRVSGYMVPLRDDNLGSPIPEEFKPSTYALEGLVRAKSRLDYLASLSPGAVERDLEHEHSNLASKARMAAFKKERLRERYDAMLARVLTWTPPTSEHEGLKTFMIEQLESSIQHDCYQIEMPVKPSPDEWIMRERERAERDAAFYTEQQTAEIERAAKRNSWLKALRASLPPEVEAI